MVGQGYVRPFLLMVIGWYMGTRQTIRKHGDDARSALLLLHPAYCFFYTMFAGTAFVLIYNERDRREGAPDPAIKCSDYFQDTYEKFGFVTDSFRTMDASGGAEVFRANNFMFRMGCVFAAQTAVAFGFAWWLRGRTARVKGTKSFKTWVFYYSVSALAAGAAAFVLVTLAAPRDPSPGEAGPPPCELDPYSSGAAT